MTAPWANGKNGKEYRSTMGAKPIGGIFSVGVEEPYRWKDSVQSGPEIRLWVLDGIANGLRPWFTKFAGSLYDRRWLKVVEDLYVWHHRNERYLRNTQPLARVALVYSQQTSHFYGGPQARQKVEDHTLGYYQALIEARIPFRDGARSTAGRRAHRPVQGAGVAEYRGALRRRSARRFATTWSAAAASWPRTRRRSTTSGASGAPISDSPIVFGASFDGAVDARMQNSYLNLEGAPGKRHPLLAGLDDTGRIINGVSRVHTKTLGTYANPPITLVPSYPDLPMEEVFPRMPRTDIPEVFVREVGKGRVVYFPWDIDRTFWEVLCVDHGKLLRNAVQWALNEAPVVTVTGAGVLDVTVWQQAVVDDRAPGESDQSHDDEGSAARVPAGAAAGGHGATARGSEGEKGATAGQRSDSARARGQRRHHAHDRYHRGPRSDRHRSVERLAGCPPNLPSGRTGSCFPDIFGLQCAGQSTN